MSRYRGPRVKKMRALGLDLPGLSRKSIERRPQPPGQHGANRRGKLSDYARQLREKQKLRLNYGLSERQFTRLMEAAKRSKMPSGRKLGELLERRLDNVVREIGERGKVLLPEAVTRFPQPISAQSPAPAPTEALAPAPAPA